MTKDYIENLRKKYDDLAIDAVEKIAKSEHSQLKSSQEKFFEILYYLKKTGRYMENKYYNKLPWDTYLRQEYGIREGTFNKMIYAYGQYPEMARKYGPGLVNAVKSKCGAEKVAPLMEKIAKLKKPKHSEINEMINKNMKPSVIAENDKPTRRELKNEIARLKDHIATLNMELSEKDAQIKRLKATVDKYKSMPKIKPPKFKHPDVFYNTQYTPV